MKKKRVLLIFFSISTLLYAQNYINQNIFNVDVIEKNLLNQEYFEMPYGYFLKAKIPPRSNFILFVYNVQKYGPIYCENNEGQTIVKFNSFAREEFIRKPIASYPSPVCIIFYKTPEILSIENEIIGVIVARFLKVIDGTPYFQLIEGIFSRNMSEHLIQDNTDISPESFGSTDGLRYVNSML